MGMFVMTVADGAETSLFDNILFLFHKNLLSKIFTLQWQEMSFLLGIIYLRIFIGKFCYFVKYPYFCQ